MDDTVKLQIWNKAKIVDGFDPDKYRQDTCGAWMIFEEYDKIDSIYGWQIDHACPQSLLKQKGFSQAEIDNPENLRAMQWENNQSKNDDYPSYISKVTSEGNKNIKATKSLNVNNELQKKIKTLYNI
ncbi:MAG: hypothetical protein LBC68_03725 [Prevotellaceae bacterium]|jgi:hypothetical protein|nr:hypothetical protein [Prevotellaceae bacterium]